MLPEPTVATFYFEVNTGTYVGNKKTAYKNSDPTRIGVSILGLEKPCKIPTLCICELIHEVFRAICGLFITYFVAR